MQQAISGYISQTFWFCYIINNHYAHVHTQIMMQIKC
jgi:hypothetical protein